MAALAVSCRSDELQDDHMPGRGESLKTLQVGVDGNPQTRVGFDDMKFIFTADRRITGEFTADLSADTPVIETDDAEGNTVTISFSNNIPGNSGAFYIPAPVGDYGSITAEVKDGDVSLLTKTWTDQTVSRKTPKRGSAALDYVAEISGTPYSTLQAAFDAADNQTIIL